MSSSVQPANPCDPNLEAAQQLIREVQAKLAQDDFFLAAAQQWLDGVKVFRMLQGHIEVPTSGNAVIAYNTLVTAFRAAGMILLRQISPDDIQQKLGVSVEVFRSAVDELSAEDYSLMRSMTAGEADDILIKCGLMEDAPTS